MNNELRVNKNLSWTYNTYCDYEKIFLKRFKIKNL